MNRNVRVFCWGLGAMGAGVASLLLERGNYEIVGAISHQVGEDVGAVLGGAPLGVLVGENADSITRVEADVCVIATHTLIKDVFDQVMEAVRAGMNVVTSAEQMFYPAAGEPELAAQIDEAARAKSVSVLGTGINPGFVMDTLIVALGVACTRIRTITARRVNDLSPFGATVLKAFGIGCTTEEYEAGVADGTVLGHVGFDESIRFISEQTGLRVDEVRQSREPIITDADRPTRFGAVAAGHVVGSLQIGEGLCSGKSVIRLEHPQQLSPEAAGEMTGDFITIDGDPPIQLAIQPEIEGGQGTIALLANSIPRLLAAPPGILTMAELGLPRFFGATIEGDRH